MPPFNDLNQTVLNQLLDRQRGMPYAARAVLRTQLGLPAETAPAPSAATATNAVEHATTNSVSPCRLALAIQTRDLTGHFTVPGKNAFRVEAVLWPQTASPVQENFSLLPGRMAES